MNHNKKLIVLVGNIGSGKTTLARKYAKKGYIIIARDALRYAIGGGDYIFDLKLEPAIWSSEKNIVENFMNTDVNIVIDEIGITKTMREPYISLAYKYSYSITALVLPQASMKESVDRRLKDPHGQPDRELWEGIYKKFESQCELPMYSEGFNRIIKLKRW